MLTKTEPYVWQTGKAGKPKKMLTTGNIKTAKNFVKHNVATIALQLAPAKESRFNVCPFAGACAELCLKFTGHNQLKGAKSIRVHRTEFLFEDSDGFKDRLFKELDSFKKKCDKLGCGMGVRLNCLSDVVWEAKFPEVFTRYPDAIFYDYTKIPTRYQRYLDGKLPSNYHLTYSLSGENPSSHESAKSFLSQGGTVAIVFDELPPFWNGYPVYNGDDSDARWLDQKGSIVGLSAKGPAVKDTTGFVIRAIRVRP